MAEEHAAKGITGGIGHFFTQTTAGLPNWAWLLVIGGGIAAAIIVPRLFGGTSTTDQTGTDTSGTTPDTTSGAVPTYDTGVGGGGGYAPYDYSGQSVTPPPQPTTTAQAGTDTSQQTSRQQLNAQNALTPSAPTLNPWVPAVTPAPGERWYEAYQQRGESFGTQPTPQISGGKYQNAKYVTVGSWPSKELGWGAIASKYHTTVKRLEQLNPTIPGLNQGGHGSAHPGETIRIA